MNVARLRGLLRAIILLVRLHFFLEKLSVFVLVFTVLGDVIGEIDPVGASLDPGCLRHRGINLLQIELTLDALFVDVGDHVWWFYEWHRK